MPEQLDLFTEGRARRDAGLALLDDDTYETDLWLLRAREAALFLASTNGTVTIDEVRDEVGDPPNPNLCGLVFRTGWKFTGEMVESTRPERHGAWNRKWRRD